MLSQLNATTIEGRTETGGLLVFASLGRREHGRGDPGPRTASGRSSTIRPIPRRTGTSAATLAAATDGDQSPSATATDGDDDTDERDRRHHRVPRHLRGRRAGRDAGTGGGPDAGDRRHRACRAAPRAPTATASRPLRRPPFGADSPKDEDDDGLADADAVTYALSLDDTGGDGQRPGGYAERRASGATPTVERHDNRGPHPETEHRPLAHHHLGGPADAGEVTQDPGPRAVEA